MRTMSLALVVSVLSWGFGCGGGKPPVETTSEEMAPAESAPEENVSVEGLLGKIDDSIVEDVFRRNQERILACYQNEALEVLEEIEGKLSAFIEVDRTGTVSTAYFVDGDLGSNAAQSCFLDVIARIAFPPPIGGTRAEMRFDFPLLEEPYNHPAPFDWSGETIDVLVSEHQSEVDNCLGGLSGVSLTLYVGSGGRVRASGGTGTSKEAYLAAECLSAAAMSWVFDDPGKKRPAKATVRF